jgi:hypothetical protein
MAENTIGIKNLEQRYPKLYQGIEKLRNNLQSTLLTLLKCFVTAKPILRARSKIEFPQLKTYNSKLTKIELLQLRQQKGVHHPYEFCTPHFEKFHIEDYSNRTS